MSNIRIVALLASLVVSPVASAYAQSAPPPATPQSAYQSFQRALLTVGKPLTELARIWPGPVSGPELVRDLRLTAAHTIRFSSSGNPEHRQDTTRHVSSMTLVESFIDTIAFKSRINELMTELSTKLGPPDECSLPLGPPLYVAFQQNPGRIWRKGLLGFRTVLEWEVTSAGQKLVTIYVGKFSDTLGDKIPCAATLF
jgi:hypothetical protein